MKRDNLKFSDFEKRDDLCKRGQSRILYANGRGYIVKVGNKWYATNDVRTELLGILPNIDLAHPTVGPHKSARDAFEEYKLERNR